MNSPGKPEMTWYEFTFRAVAFVLLLVTLFFGFFAFVCRIDGEDEFRIILAYDVLLGIPAALAAMFTFLGRRNARKNWRRSLLLGMLLLVFVWMTVAILFIVWHCRQIAARGGTDVLLEWLGRALGA